MCDGISARVRRPMPSAAASPPRPPEPSATTSASTVAPTAGCAVGAGCCVAWEVVLPGKRGAPQQAAAVEAQAVTTYPTPPRATIRRLATSEGSPWATLGK